MGRLGITLNERRQKGQVPIVLITNVVVEQSLVDALADLHSLDDVLNEIAFIRVAAF